MVKTIADSDKSISFDEAWKDFLIIRAITYKLPVRLDLDSEQRVVRVVIKSLPERELEGQQYFCDDSTYSRMGITLAYHRNIVLPEMENKIIKPYLGKPLEEWERDALKGKIERFKSKIEARLGGALRSEVERLISERHYWEALFSLHQILEHRIRRMLMYKSMDLDRSNSRIFVNEKKEKFCKEEIKTFKSLTKIACLIGAIDEETRKKLVSFDRKRDSIAHKVLRKQIPRHILKNHCKHGLDLMDTLERYFADIVPKPKFIRMQEFEVMTGERSK